MKKIGLLLLIVTQVLTGFSQKNRGYDAVSHYREYTITDDIKSLDKAKENIDLASVHEATKDKAKIQVTKGQIYLALYEWHRKNQEITLESTIEDPNKRMIASFKGTPTKELEIAYAAFQRGKVLDVKGRFVSELRQVINIGVYYNNTGIANYNSKQFTEAFTSFEKAYEISSFSDSTILSYCAISADLSENLDKAKMYCQKMIDHNQIEENTYSSLMNVFLKMKDTASAIQAMKKGRAQHPKNLNLIISEANHFIRIGEHTKALNNVNTAISVKADNSNLYLVRASIYEDIATPKDSLGDYIVRPADYDSLIKNAEADYVKASELDPENFDVYFYLGVLFNNQGVYYNKKADALPVNEEYKSINEKANEFFNRAVVPFEKAMSIKPDDRNTLIALKQIYTRLRMLDKLRAVDEKLKN